MSGYARPGVATHAERSARIVAAVIGALAVVGVLVAMLSISDHTSSGSTPGAGGAPAGVGGAGPAGANPSSDGHLQGAAGRAYLRAHFPYPSDATLPPATAAPPEAGHTYRVTRMSLEATKAFYAAALPKIGATYVVQPDIVQNGTVQSYDGEIGPEDVGYYLGDVYLQENRDGLSPGLVTIDVDID